MKVLGLDPGSQKLGFGVLQEESGRCLCVLSGTLRLNTRLSLAARLEVVHREVQTLLRAHAPDLVAIEECFVAQSPKAALVLGQVRGVLLLAVQQEGIRLAEFSPRAIKLAVVGHGGAAKEQVQYMMGRLISGCPSKLGPDEADALAVAWCGAQHQGVAEMVRSAGDVHARTTKVARARGTRVAAERGGAQRA